MSDLVKQVKALTDFERELALLYMARQMPDLFEVAVAAVRELEGRH